MGSPQPGWYADPTQPGQLRWWDGQAWTGQIRQPPSQPSSPHQPPQPPQPSPLEQPSRPQQAWGDPTGIPESATFSGPGDAPPGLPPVGFATEASASGTGRRRALVGVGVGVAGLAAALAIFVPEEGSVFDLAVGDCFDKDQAFVEDDVDVDTVPFVDCAEPHDSQVFALFDLDIDQYPGDQVAGDLALFGCLDRFEDHLGLPLEFTSLDVSTLRPTPESWARGDREVVCSLDSAVGERLVGSELEQSRSWSLMVGDCFDAPVIGQGEVQFGRAYQPVNCGVEHVGEIYLVMDLPSGEYPGSESLYETADEVCLDQFERSLGVPWEDSVLAHGYVTPSLGRWASGDRALHCYAFDFEGPIVGPAEQWDAAVDPSTDALSAYDVTALDVGDCFDDPFDEVFDGPVPAVPCGEPHHNEVFLWFDVAGNELPDDLDQRVIERCDTRFHDYVGQGRDTLTWFWIGPTPDSWQTGDRRVVCALYAEDFSDLVGSRKTGPV